jgi:hypothetical protein
LVLVLPLLATPAAADIFWYTDPGVAEVRSFDSVTNTLGPVVVVPAPPPPLVAPTYAIGGPWGIDSLRSAITVGPLIIYADNPYVVVVDGNPANPTYNQVIQTIDMRDPSIPTDDPGVLFCKFHPAGTRIYASCVGSATTPPSIRIARQILPLPAPEYDFDPIAFPADKLTNEAGGEWLTLPTTPFAGGAGVHVPWGLDVNPTATQVYFCCHQESGFLFHSDVHGFSIDASGNYVANFTVAETPSATFEWPYQIEVSPSLVDFASGGSRALVSHGFEVDLAPPAAPDPVNPGFVIYVNVTTNAAIGEVQPAIIPPNLDPSLPFPPVPPVFYRAFDYPVGIAWLSGGTAAFVADRDISVPPPAVDGIIAGRVAPGTGATPDSVYDYFNDPTPTPADSDPRYRGVAVDNDDAEVVFCDLGATAAAPGSIVVYDIDGNVISTLVLAPGSDPQFITCQSGTGVGGVGGGGGGGSGGSGGTADNDNGDETFHDSDDHHSKKRCFVATASWGAGSRNVRDLVGFRGSWLHGAQAGRVFDRMYYGFGPSAAAGISASGSEAAGRCVLAPFAFAAKGGAATAVIAAALLALLGFAAVRRMM